MCSLPSSREHGDKPPEYLESVWMSQCPVPAAVPLQQSSGAAATGASLFAVRLS